jgi:hypothetical protein
MRLVLLLRRDFTDQNGFKWKYHPMITGNNYSTHGVHGYMYQGEEIWIEQTDQIRKYLDLLKG